MSRIRGRDTGPERKVAAILAELGAQVDTQARDLPGRPDFVHRGDHIVIFVDGDFWHGWRFADWGGKLAPFWANKIRENIRRDRRNRDRLRRHGWKVVRFWEHDIELKPASVRKRLAKLLLQGSAPATPQGIMPDPGK